MSSRNIPGRSRSRVAPTATVEQFDQRAAARQIALRRLELREHTRYELARILGERGIAPAVVEPLLDSLESSGLVDDNRYAQSWVEIRGRAGHRSIRALRRELQEKGVSAEAIAGALADFTSDDELAAARAFAARRYRGGDDKASQRRLMARLARRGYPTSVCLAVVTELSAAPVDRPAADVEED